MMRSLFVVTSRDCALAYRLVWRKTMPMEWGRQEMGYSGFPISAVLW